MLKKLLKLLSLLRNQTWNIFHLDNMYRGSMFTSLYVAVYYIDSAETCIATNKTRKKAERKGER